MAYRQFSNVVVEDDELPFLIQEVAVKEPKEPENDQGNVYVPMIKLLKGERQESTSKRYAPTL